jgi:uncharacterized coiled-coil protein SlyX
MTPREQALALERSELLSTRVDELNLVVTLQGDQIEQLEEDLARAQRTSAMYRAEDAKYIEKIEKLSGSILAMAERQINPPLVWSDNEAEAVALAHCQYTKICFSLYWRKR